MTQELKQELYAKMLNLRDHKAELKAQQKLDKLSIKTLEAEIEEIVTKIEKES